MSALALSPAASDADIAAGFAVLRQLRPHLADAAELVARVRRQEAEGYRLLLAWESGRVVGAAGYRVQENLIRGRFAYVDDLVVLEGERRRAIGAMLHFARRLA
jgi:Acetyltransferase (GNAT) family